MLDVGAVRAGHILGELGDGGGVVGQFTARIVVNGNANYTSAPGDLTGDGKADIYAGQDGQDGYLINTTPSGSMSLSFSTVTLQTNNPSAANCEPSLSKTRILLQSFVE